MPYKVYIKCFMCFMDLSTFSFLKSTRLKWLSLGTEAPKSVFSPYTKTALGVILLISHSPAGIHTRRSDSLVIILTPTAMGGTLLFYSSIYISELQKKKHSIYICKLWHTDKNKYQHTVVPDVQPDICVSVLNKSGLALLWLHPLSKCFMHHPLLRSLTLQGQGHQY